MARILTPRTILLAGALGALLASQPAQAGDAARGARLFDTECADCHVVKQGGGNRKGPNLCGILGRPRGKVEGFKYSDANLAAGVTWDAPTLTRYLASPKKAMPGTAMRFAGFDDAKDIDDVVAYLATLR